MQATQSLLQDFNPQKLAELKQDDISGILQNLTDISAKFQQNTIALVKQIIQVDSDYDNNFKGLFHQDFNLQFMINQSMSGMKNSKQQVRDDFILIATQVFPWIQNQDPVIKEIESLFKSSKNQFQKQSMLQTLAKVTNTFDAKGIQKVSACTQTLLTDQNNDVRSMAQQLLQILESTEPQLAKVVKSQVKSSPALKKTVKPVVDLKLQRQQASKEPQSLFPTPSDNDKQAQNAPFSIVPWVQQSYLAFKPIYLFQINFQPSKQLQQLQQIITNGQINEIKESLQLFLQNLKSQFESQDWQNQMISVQQIYQLLLVDNQFNAPQINIIIGQEIVQFLTGATIIALIQSPRSTLSRESLIVLEFVMQRYGSICQQFATTLIDTLINNFSHKGVYYECQSVSLLKTIIVHCSVTKTVYQKACAQAKIQKVPSAKCFCLDIAIMSLVLLKQTSQLDGSMCNAVSDLLLQGIADANGRIRQTARAAINSLQYIYQNGYLQILQKLGPKDKDLLLLDENNIVGYKSYDKPIICNINDDSYPSYVFQSGACNQEIYPIFEQLYQWRFQICMDDSFHIEWGEIGQQKTDLVTESEYAEGIGFGVGQTAGYMNTEQNLEEYQEETTSEIKSAKSMQEQGQKSFSKRENQSDRNNKSMQQETQSTTRSNHEKPSSQIDVTSEQIEQVEKQLQIGHVQIKNFMQGTQDVAKLVTNNEIIDNQEDKEDDNISDDVMKALNDEAETVVNLRPQLIEKSILLNDVKTDLINIQEFVENDELSSNQIEQLLYQIVTHFQQSDEGTKASMQNLIMQVILTNYKELKLQSLNQIVILLIDLFNDKSLQIRRKSDELLRAIIETANPEDMFKFFVSIINNCRITPQKQINVNASMRLITYVIRKMSQKQKVLQAIPPLIPLIVEQFGNTDMNMRKTAVSCFIDLFMVLGAEFQSYIDRLNDVQLKLVIERMKQIKQKK